MIYNYTKCESVIAKIMADLNMTENNIRITDMREWIFEAIDKIGAPMQYIKKESGVEGEPILKIEDYQVPLPSGLQVLDGVAYSLNPTGPWQSMRTSTAQFNRTTQHVNNCSGELMPEKIHTPAQLYTINGVRYLEKHIVGTDEDLTYFIKPGWIVTNQKDGFIKLAYKTIPTDERGYPLIPDLSSYREAIYWYVVMKLNFANYLKGQLGGKGVNNAQNTYFYIQQQWNFYRNQAYAEAMMPTAGDMESIKNEWNKLMPEWDNSQTFFTHQGAEQTLLNDYYYGY